MTKIGGALNNTGNFGNLAEQYRTGRKGVPEEVLDYLWSHTNISSKILDVGCGTGLPTRQLALRGAEVIGVDVDVEMIKVAKEEDSSDITYLISPVDNLPFPDNIFDFVTSFSAFHWFPQPRSTNEMKRVLKPGGIVFVVNKNDVGDFSEGFRAIIRKFSIKDLPQIKKDYRPKQLLEKSGFQNVTVKRFSISEYYDLHQVMDFFQSVSGWNLVPIESKIEALALLKKYAIARSENGLVERKLEIVTLTGFK